MKNFCVSNKADNCYDERTFHWEYNLILKMQCVNFGVCNFVVSNLISGVWSHFERLNFLVK